MKIFKIQFGLSICLLAAAGFLLSAGVKDEKRAGTEAAESLYKRWAAMHFSQQPVEVPKEGITIKKENATWVLEQGTFKLMEPTRDGKVTGLVFRGKGHFHMTIPDWVEREHLRRCSGKNVFDEMDTRFTFLIMRTPGPMLDDLASTYNSGSYVRDKSAASWHKIWLKRDLEDINARVLAGIVNPGDDYLRVGMDTETFGEITYVFDHHLQEEIQIRKLRKKYNYSETWVSLDRESDRLSTGRPGSNQRPRFDMTGLNIEGDLTKMKLETGSASLFVDEAGSKVYLPPWWVPRDPDDVTFKAKLSFTPKTANLRMVELALPRAKIRSVKDGTGKSLRFFRKKATNDSYDPFTSSFWVLLDKPCALNEIVEIEIVYGMELLNFGEGGNWYPTFPDHRGDRFMVEFTAKQRKNHGIQAVGELVEKQKKGKATVSLWTSKKPVDLYGFTVFKEMAESRIDVKNVPTAAVYGEELSDADMRRNVAIDISNSLKFYQHIFRIDFPYKTVRGTYIESGFGQALPGLLLLSKNTFHSEHPGASELFRAHEAAHLIWGYMIDGKTYRDAWISEAFAEFSAMLYVQAVMPKKKHYNAIIDGFTSELLGSVKTRFSKYTMPWQLVRRNRDKIGPISLGYRSSGADFPVGYQLQSYHKGALVLHMLRMMMKNRTGNDAFFLATLREFLHTCKGKRVTTDDFKRVIERRTKQDWSWFFNQWVHGTAIPVYDWDYKKKGKNKTTGKYELVVTVTQSGVPGGFKMPVPLRVFLKDGNVRQFNLPVNKETQTFTLSFDKKIKKVRFNPDQAVICRMK